LLKATPRQLIADLADDDEDFADVEPHTILQHLWTNYGTITSKMLKDNLVKLHEEWDISKPITTVWSRIKKCQNFTVKGNEPIQDSVIVRAVINTITNTKAFTLDVRDWENKDQSNQTLEELKKFFNKANQQCLKKPTAATEGYAGKAEQVVTPEKTTEEQKNYSTNTATVLMYCWTHGLNWSHFGKNCTAKADGHKDEATVEKMMFGNSSIRPRPTKRKRHNDDSNNNKRNKKRDDK